MRARLITTLFAVVGLLAVGLSDAPAAVAAPKPSVARIQSTSAVGKSLRRSSQTIGAPALTKSGVRLSKVRRDGRLVTMATAAAASLQTVSIGFDEIPLGTAVGTQYVPSGIQFGGDSPFTTSDGANPTSPVLSGSPLFQGSIEGEFVSPGRIPRTVTNFALDVGYIDDPNSIVVQTIDSAGNPLDSTPVTSLGIVHVVVNGTGIAGFRVFSVSTEEAGFAIDNVSFPGWTTVDGQPSVNEQGGPSNPSEQTTTCHAGKPVNCATGVFFHQFQDILVPGRGMPLDFNRTYSADQASQDGPLGYGWTYDYEMSLATDPDTGDVTVHQENGSAVSFSPDGNGNFTAPTRVLATLTRSADGSWTFTRIPSHDAFVFSTTGTLTAVQDRNGDATTFNYANGQLRTVTDPAGRTLSLTWTGSHISTVTDPMGRAVSFTYGAAGDLVGATDRAGHTWTFGYDANHLLTTMTDARGYSVSNVYDAQNRVVSQTDQAGRVTTWVYSGDPTGAGAVNTMTDPDGAVTVYRYAKLELTSVTTGAGTQAAATTSYSYDPQTLARSVVTNPNGVPMYSTYDAHANVLSSTDGAGDLTAFTYNEFDEVLTKTSPLGEVTSYTYDARGNLTSITDPLGGVSADNYGSVDHPGDITSTTDPDGRVKDLDYDSYGNVASVTSHPSATVADVTSYRFDADSEQVCLATATAAAAGVSCPAAGAARVPGTATTTYDPDGLQLAVTDPNGHTTRFGYDAVNNRTTVTDPLGRVTRTDYDADERVTAVTTGATGSAPSTTSTSYDDLAGSATCTAPAALYCTDVTDPRGQQTSQAYDARGELVQTTRPDGELVRWSYDPEGNKVDQVDTDNRYTTYSYDAANRLTGIGYSANDGGPVASVARQTVKPADDGAGSAIADVSYAFDADGRRTSMNDGTGQSSYSYDVDGRLTQTVDGAGHTVTYGYDGAGHPITIGYPNGQQVQRTYNGAGWLSAVTDWLGRTTTFSYDADGDLTATGYPNGDTVRRAYDAANQLSSVGVGSATSSLATMSYVRNAAAQTTAETDSGALTGNTQYTYDDRGLLTGVNATNYAYDRSDDATTFGAVSQTFDDAQRLVSSGNTSYSYDNEGERLTSTPTVGDVAFDPTSYTYDQAGRLTSVSRPTPTITALSATAGPRAGHNTVVISGSGFDGVTAVHFGTASASFTVAGPGSISVSAPAGTGTVAVTVLTATGTSNAVSYSYPPGPTVTAVSPPSGPPVGGTTVTLTGTAFTGASAVHVGTSSVPFTVLSATQLTLTTPAGSGTVGITVTTPGGTSASLAAARFSYLAKPSVNAVSPDSGPIGGGGSVTITGAGFSGATAVRFGSTIATFTIGSATSITATVPAGALGTVDVTVTAPTGTSVLAAADRYSYLSTPSISSISPAAGPVAGGSTVTVTGRGFTGVTGVTFGSKAATGVTVLSATQLTAVSPAATASRVQVSVLTGHGTSAPVSFDLFSYLARPSVSAISPNVGRTAGGTTVTITGTSLSGVTAVSFGSTPAASFSVTSATSINAVSPAGTGTVDLTVSSAGGTSGKVTADRFGYSATAPAAARLRTADVAPVAQDVTSYGYDGDGLRTSKVTAAGTEPYVWSMIDGGSELLADGATSYLYGPNGKVIAQLSDTSVSYFVPDALGSTRMLLAADGTVAATFDYSGYGAVTAHTGTAGTPLLYLGGYLDAESGLLFLQHRYYDAGTGQFLSVDPIVGSTWTPYAYASGDPVNLIDPTGLWGFDPIGWVVDNSSMISAVTGTAALFAAFLPPPADILSPILGAVSFGTGAIATGKDIAEGNYGQAVVDGLGTVLGGAGLVEDIGAKIFMAGAREAWDAGEPVIDLARQSEQWEARGSLLDHGAAASAWAGIVTEELFDHSEC